MPSEQQAMLKQLGKLHARYERAVATLAELEVERAEMYQAARDLDPPLTFRAIAGVFGVTEAAVMQKLRRTAEANEKASR